MAAPTLTFGTLVSEIERELDLEDEDFIGSQEMIDAFNEGVREVEAHIHKLGLEDIYFKTRGLLSLTNGSNEVQLPSNIHDYKIIRIVWAETARVYEIARLRKNDHYLKMEDERLNGSNSSDYYRYEILYNTANSGPMIYLVPAARETTATKAVIYYIRQAQRMASTATLVDLPTSAVNYLKKYVQWKAYFKEGHPSTAEAEKERDLARNLMIETLTNMVPDNDSVIEKDLTTYEEMN